MERFIIEREIQITRQLAECDDGMSKLGITGIDTYKDALSDHTKYVKYNPTYIYGSGMATYGMIPDTSIYQLIMEISKIDAEEPHNKRRLKGEDNTEDAQEMTGDKQLILTSGEQYNFMNGTSMSLSLTPTEAKFVKDKILESPYCKGTLLAFLINKDSLILNDEVSYYKLAEQLNGLDEDVRDIYDKSVLFSKLINLVDWSFNHAYYCSFDNEEGAMTCKQAYEELYEIHKGTITDQVAYLSLFDYTRAKDPMLTDFCENCYNVLIEEGINALNSLDTLGTSRERSVKRERSKIGNNDYRTVKRGNPGYNDYRWNTVRTMVDEIRNPQ